MSPLLPLSVYRSHELMNCIYFTSTREAGLGDVGAVHTNEDTDDLEGKSELEEWCSHSPCLSV